MKIKSLLMILFLFISCSEEKTVDLDTMTKTYVKVMINKQIYKSHKDSLKIKVQEVYDEMGITEDEFLKALETYSDDKEKWDEFYNKSMIYLDSLRVKDNVKKASSSPRPPESLHM